MASIKISYQNELRRVQFDGQTVAALRALLVALQLPALQGRLQWRDDEGDLCTIGSDCELKEALRCNEGKVLKLFLVASEAQADVAISANGAGGQQPLCSVPASLAPAATACVLPLKQRFKIVRKYFSRQGVQVVFLGFDDELTAPSDAAHFAAHKTQLATAGVLLLGHEFVEFVHAHSDKPSLVALCERTLADERARGSLPTAASTAATSAHSAETRRNAVRELKQRCKEQRKALKAQQRAAKVEAREGLKQLKREQKMLKRELKAKKGDKDD